MARGVRVYLFAVLCTLRCFPEVGSSHTHDDIIRSYFDMDFSYHLILCFLVALHGIYVSLSTLKHIIRRLNLGRRECYSSLRYVGRCLLVRSIYHVICHVFMSLCMCRENFIIPALQWDIEQYIKDYGKDTMHVFQGKIRVQ